MNKKSSVFNYFIWSLICIVAVGTAIRVYNRVTDDFRLGNMTYDIPYHPDWDIPKLSTEDHTQLSQILNQKYYYIGKGAQSYAFGSEDDRYVLKFFKFKHLKPSLFVKLIPPIGILKSYRQEQEDRKLRKLESVFEGYKLAYELNREDSGLLFIHLNPTEYLHQQVTLVDKIGMQHLVNLDPIVFLVQKKGNTLRSTISKYLDKKNIAEANDAVSQILNMYTSEYRKGIYDRDHGVMHNTGFVDGKPFHLDVGKMSKNDTMRQLDVYKNDLKIISWKIDAWVKSNYPHQYTEISDHIAKEYQRQTGDQFDVKQINPKDFKIKKRKVLF